MDARRVETVAIASRKNEHGEWVVRAYDQNGRRYPAADYFTDDKADAIGTAAAMLAAVAAAMVRPAPSASDAN